MDIGIIGGGGISESHARAVGEIDGARVAAVYGQNQERAARLAAAHDAPSYDTLDDFLRHRPMNVVAIGSPSGRHAEQGIAAARAGLHVLVEKPIDVSLDRADALIEECARNNVKLGVFFQDRAAPDLRRLKELLDDGVLGRMLLVSARVKWYRPPEYYTASRWRGTRALDGGGALINQGVHTVDTLLWLCGDVDGVAAHAGTLLHQIEVEDALTATLRFTSGALGTLEATTAAYPGFPRRIELSGTEGTIVVEGDRVAEVHLRHGATREQLFSAEASNHNASSSSAVISDVGGHRRLVENFIRAIRDDARPLCDGREGRRSLALVEAIYRAARERGEIQISNSSL